MFIDLIYKPELLIDKDTWDLNPSNARYFFKYVVIGNKVGFATNGTIMLVFPVANQNEDEKYVLLTKEILSVARKAVGKIKTPLMLNFKSEKDMIGTADGNEMPMVKGPTKEQIKEFILKAKDVFDFAKLRIEALTDRTILCFNFKYLELIVKAGFSDNYNLRVYVTKTMVEAFVVKSMNDNNKAVGLLMPYYPVDSTTAEGKDKQWAKKNQLSKEHAEMWDKFLEERGRKK